MCHADYRYMVQKQLSSRVSAQAINSAFMKAQLKAPDVTVRKAFVSMQLSVQGCAEQGPVWDRTLQRSAQIIISSRSRSMVHRDMRGIMSCSTAHKGTPCSRYCSTCGPHSLA